MGSTCRATLALRAWPRCGGLLHRRRGLLVAGGCVRNFLWCMACVWAPVQGASQAWVLGKGGPTAGGLTAVAWQDGLLCVSGLCITTASALR